MRSILKITFTIMFSWSIIASSALACACISSNKTHHCCEKKVSSHCPKADSKFNSSKNEFCQCPSALESQAVDKHELKLKYSETTFALNTAVHLDSLKSRHNFFKFNYQLQNLPPGIPIFLANHTLIL